jgi:hypothetical protein
VDLSDFAGRDVLFRWRFACDYSVGGEGWWVDDVSVKRVQPCGTVVYVSASDNDCNGAVPCEKTIKDALDGVEGVAYVLVAQGEYEGPVVIGVEKRVVVGYTLDFQSMNMTAPVTIISP